MTKETPGKNYKITLNKRLAKFSFNFIIGFSVKISFFLLEIFDFHIERVSELLATLSF